MLILKKLNSVLGSGLGVHQQHTLQSLKSRNLDQNSWNQCSNINGEKIKPQIKFASKYILIKG